MSDLKVEDLIGSWEIVKSDVCGKKMLDLGGKAELWIESIDSERGEGQMKMLNLDADLDVRFSMRDGQPCFEFSWESDDKRHCTCGRGWGILKSADRIEGHFFIHRADDSSFSARRRKS